MIDLRSSFQVAKLATLTLGDAARYTVELVAEMSSQAKAEWRKPE